MFQTLQPETVNPNKTDDKTATDSEEEPSAKRAKYHRLFSSHTKSLKLTASSTLDTVVCVQNGFGVVIASQRWHFKRLRI